MRLCLHNRRYTAPRARHRPPANAQSGILISPLGTSRRSTQECQRIPGRTNHAWRAALLPGVPSDRVGDPSSTSSRYFGKAHALNGLGTDPRRPRRYLVPRDLRQPTPLFSSRRMSIYYNSPHRRPRVPELRHTCYANPPIRGCPAHCSAPCGLEVSSERRSDCRLQTPSRL